MYVIKFRGAGQGAKALVAELVAGELARAAGLPIPEIVLMDLDPLLARTEPDQEIRDLVKASAGINIALDYLPGSVTFDPVVIAADSQLASDIVWFDAFVTNVDRTVRNSNILVWHKKLWLIDHGAALYLHHTDGGFANRSRETFPLIRDHILLRHASLLRESDARMSARLTEQVIDSVVSLIPETWLSNHTGSGDAVAQPDHYRNYLLDRVTSPRPFLEDAIAARAMHV